MAERDPANRTEGTCSAQSTQNSRLRQFAICFPILLAAGFGLLLAPFSRPAVNECTAVAVTVSAHLVSLFGGSIVR